MRQRQNAFADLAALTVATKRDPRWQRLAVGMRVHAVGRPRLGTVVAISQVTTRVRVRWTNAVRFTEIWPTDYLVIVSEPEDPA